MAKKTRTAATKPLELDKVLKVAGQDYNVNAVHATQVDNKLIIKNIDINGNATPVEFNGSADTEISVVPSTGGAFSGPLRAPSAIDIKEGSNISREAVLNYGDFNDVILKSLINNSILYTWATDTGTLSPAKDSNSEITGISLVSGHEESLTTITSGFADKNNANKWLPAYLFICTDSGNIYFGTSASTASTVTRLATSTINATKADELSNPQSIQVNLASTQAISLTGNANSTSTVNPGVKGTLNIANGGTGATTEAKAAYNLFKDMLEYNTSIADDFKLVFKAPNSTGAEHNILYTKPITKLVTYIKDKLGFAPAATAPSQPNSNLRMTVPYGGTGRTTLNVNSVLLGDGTDHIKDIVPANGAFFATGATDTPKFGILPVAQGGTGTTSLANITVGNATNATKATQDSTGRNISTGYLRTSSTTNINCITISNTEPGSPKVGDIWIKI